MLDQMRITAMGDSAVLAELGELDFARCAAVADELRKNMPEGVVSVICAFDTLAVFYDPATMLRGHRNPVGHLTDWIRSTAATSQQHTEAASPLVEIPVTYGGSDGPDLQELARVRGMTTDSLIALHASVEYRVLAVGFQPGFGYLGGLPDMLHSPRRASPRTSVPDGSVGIGGPYTGVYPFNSPGGWNIIGKTDVVMFDTSRPNPSVLSVGMRVRFRPVSAR